MERWALPAGLYPGPPAFLSDRRMTTTMRREKRTSRVVAYIHPSKAERLAEFAYESNVRSISDYLFELVEKHIEEKDIEQEMNSIRVSKQKVGSRVGRN